MKLLSYTLLIIKNSDIQQDNVNNIYAPVVLSHVWLSATPWTVAHQAPFSWDFPDKNTGVVAFSLCSWSA